MFVSVSSMQYMMTVDRMFGNFMNIEWYEIV